MKNLYLYIFLVIASLASCDGVKDLQPTPQSANEVVPQIVVNAIKKEFPEATEMKFLVVEKSKIWESEFKVNVKKMSAFVNHLGQITESYSVASEIELPESAKIFITLNYGDATIKNVSQQLDKDKKVIGYKVLLLTKDNKEVTMIFDATGTLTLLVLNNKSDKPAIIPKTYLIEQKDLPEPIKIALTTKHGEYKFLKAAITTTGDGKTYSVVLSKDLTVFEYVFDEKGNVLKSSSVSVNPVKIEDKVLEEKDLPATIKAILDKDYKGWAWQKGIVSSKDGKIQGYHVLVKVDKKTYSLQFDASGKLLSKQEIGDGTSLPANIKIIEEKDLPKVIIDLLKAKHKIYRYIQIAIITDKEKKTYWVTVAVENNAYDYTFDDKGNIINSSSFTLTKPIIEEKELAAKDIPSKIKDYLDKKYVGWVFQKAKTTNVNGKLEGYLIVIKVGNDTYYIGFDAKENYISSIKG